MSDFDLFNFQVINKDIRKHNNQIWTIENADHVCTRFLFVYRYRPEDECMQFNSVSHSARIADALTLIRSS